MLLFFIDEELLVTERETVDGRKRVCSDTGRVKSGRAAPLEWWFPISTFTVQLVLNPDLEIKIAQGTLLWKECGSLCFVMS